MGTVRNVDLVDRFFYVQAILKARVGRNVDGLDMNLYNQALKILKQFQAEQTNVSTS